MGQRGQKDFSIDSAEGCWPAEPNLVFLACHVRMEGERGAGEVLTVSRFRNKNIIGYILSNNTLSHTH